MDQEHWVSLVEWFWFGIGQGCSLIWRHNCIYMCVCVCVCVCFEYFLFSCQVMSNSLQAQGLQHNRLLCPSLSPSISSVQSLSHVQLFATPWTAARQTFLSITNSWSLLKLMSIVMVIPSNLLILCLPLFLSPSIFPRIWVFFLWVGSSHQVAKV